MAGWVQIKSTGIRAPCQAFSRFDVLGSLINWILVLVSVVTVWTLRDRVLGFIVWGSKGNRSMSDITCARAAAIRWANNFAADCDGGWNIHLFAAGHITEREFCARSAMFPPDSDGSWAATEIARQAQV